MSPAKITRNRSLRKDSNPSAVSTLTSVSTSSTPGVNTSESQKPTPRKRRRSSLELSSGASTPSAPPLNTTSRTNRRVTLNRCTITTNSTSSISTNSTNSVIIPDSSTANASNSTLKRRPSSPKRSSTVTVTTTTSIATDNNSENTSTNNSNHKPDNHVDSLQDKNNPSRNTASCRSSCDPNATVNKGADNNSKRTGSNPPTCKIGNSETEVNENSSVQVKDDLVHGRSYILSRDLVWEEPYTPVDLEIADAVVRSLKVANYRVGAASTYDNKLLAQTTQTAYARISGRKWTYFVHSTRILIGRSIPNKTSVVLDYNLAPPSNNAHLIPSQSSSATVNRELDPLRRTDWLVDIDLGPEQQVSRLHAEIFYDSSEKTWFLLVNGRNGLFVDEKSFERGSRIALRSGNVINILGTQMMFLLPGTNVYIHPTIYRQSSILCDNDDDEEDDEEEEEQLNDLKYHDDLDKDDRNHDNDHNTNGDQNTKNPSNDSSKDRNRDNYGPGKDPGAGGGGGSGSHDPDDDNQNPPPVGSSRPKRTRKNSSKQLSMASNVTSPTNRSVSYQCHTQDEFSFSSQSQPSHSEYQTNAMTQPLQPPPPSSQSTVGSARPSEVPEGQISRPPSCARELMIEGPDDIDYSSDSAKDMKPPLSYAQMIGLAILSSPEEKCTLAKIYEFIKQRYSFYRHNGGGWQNSIRHNLSLSKSFEKVARRTDEPGKGMKWQIVAEHRDDFILKKGLHYSRRGGRQSTSSPHSSRIGLSSQLGQNIITSPCGFSTANLESTKRPKRPETPSLSNQQFCSHSSSTPDSNVQSRSPVLRDSSVNLSVSSTKRASLPIDPLRTPVIGSRSDVQNERISVLAAASSKADRINLLVTPAPIRAGGLSINGGDLGLAKSPSRDEPQSAYKEYDSSAPFITPLISRYQPHLAPPSTVHLPSHYVQFSSPAPFWKYVEQCGSPAISGDVASSGDGRGRCMDFPNSPLKGARSPHRGMDHLTRSCQDEDCDDDEGSESGTIAKKRRKLSECHNGLNPSMWDRENLPACSLASAQRSSPPPLISFQDSTSGRSDGGGSDCTDPVIDTSGGVGVRGDNDTGSNVCGVAGTADERRNSRYMITGLPQFELCHIRGGTITAGNSISPGLNLPRTMTCLNATDRFGCSNKAATDLTLISDGEDVIDLAKGFERIGNFHRNLTHSHTSEIRGA